VAGTLTKQVVAIDELIEEGQTLGLIE
jgi:hypothetical protein